ncbi:endo alpha-1,4 polygalactosaminidase [Oerskovia douganii]|uniref:endo alpha-1,4 polygalactosaminidase n=1 Tax=Oerskovia douganii TaxID=2762210 RepID=UPI002AB21C1B|nr:endo alpha-1,4 polygalactosaminidase [Oerskovia douganii]
MPPLPLRSSVPASLVGPALVLVLAAGCAAGPAPAAPSDREPTTSVSDAVGQGGTTPAPPPAGAGLDYQLGGAYPPPDGVTVVVRDVTDSPAGAGYDVCYVNGFQTQPGERETWLRDHPDLVLRDDAGAPVADPGWPDELLLDTSTDASRHAIAQIVGAQVDACADAGFDAVEADNLDSFTRSDGALTQGDNLALATLLIEQAHARGLAIGQKNTVELGERGPALGFDFVVTEDCAVHVECGDYAAAYGTRVLEIEYDDEPALADRLAAACARGASVVGRDRDLTTPRDQGYVFEPC